MTKDFVKQCGVCREVKKCRGKYCYACLYAKDKEKILARVDRNKPHRKGQDISKCSKCGHINDRTRTGMIIIHHKDKNPNNNKSENLEPVCIPCHTQIHKRGHNMLKYNPRYEYINGRYTPIKTKKPCPDCNKNKIGFNATRCQKCNDKRRHKMMKEGTWPFKRGGKCNPYLSIKL